MIGRVALPGTALTVSPLCLGGNRFGGELDEAGSFALLDAFAERGGNFIDTAHVYADWIPGNAPSSSERMLGAWLRARRPADVVIATKGGHPRLDDPATPRLDAASLRQDVDEARGHLGLEMLDLFYLHRDDPARPAADILAGLEALREAGAIRHYGASNWSAARLREAEAAAEANGWQGFVANQCEWSLAVRNAGSGPGDLHGMDRAMFDFHRRTRIAAVPYSAQAKGYFERDPGALPEALAKLYGNERNRETGAKLRALAEHRGVSSTQAMLAALMRAPFVTVPVIGCRSPAQLEASLAALDVALAEDEALALLESALP